MHYSNDHYGIYRGIVVDNNDPESLGRVTLKVPQIFGEEITGWAWPITGIPVHNRTPYISVIDTQNQPITMPVGSTPTNTAMVKSLSTTLEGYGITMRDDTKVSFKYSGIYNLQFSSQFVSTNSSAADIQIWLAKNGVAVPESAGQITIAGSGHGNVPSWNYVISLEADDYVELYWATDSPHVYIASNPASIGGAPHIPGVIFTATLAGGFKPNPKDGVWVMFEGGDLNFPLWLGAF